MSILKKIAPSPHINKTALKPISHKSPSSNHNAMHTTPLHEMKPAAPNPNKISDDHWRMRAAAAAAKKAPLPEPSRHRRGY